MAEPVLSVLAHGAGPIAPHDIPGAWNLDPVIVGAIATVTVLHARGRTAGPWRRRDTALALALLALALATMSPIEALAGVLAAGHMVQHVLLLLVAGPLLAMARPLPMLSAGAPPRVQRRLARLLAGDRATTARVAVRHPAVAWLAYVGVVWSWHAEALYGAALSNHGVHVAEHGSMLAAAWLFWSVVTTRPDEREDGAGSAILMVFGAALQGAFLAALLTFATTAWYPDYSATTSAFGLTPLQDQQLAGVILWVPAGLVHTGAGLVLLVRWVRQSEHESVPGPHAA